MSTFANLGNPQLDKFGVLVSETGITKLNNYRIVIIG
jgi:hypothetical protein